MTRTFTIKLGDTLPILEATLTNAAGTVQNLTGASVSFAVRRAGQKITLIDKAATVVSPATGGVVRYAWATGDTAALGVGEFEGEFQVTLAGGDVGTFPSDGYIPITVVRDIAASPTPTP